MGEYDVSRRSFLKGIGLAGLSAGALGTLGATGIAFADDAPAVEAGDAYRQLACDTALVPVKKAACPGPRGPVGFEDRDIAASDIASTEDCDIVVVGAGCLLYTSSPSAETQINVFSDGSVRRFGQRWGRRVRSTTQRRWGTWNFLAGTSWWVPPAPASSARWPG